MAVLQNLGDFGFRVCLEKCVFCQKEIKHLGFILETDGPQTDPAKIQPIINMPGSKTVAKLQVFIGMLAFYGAFIAKIKDLEAAMVGAVPTFI